MNSKGEELRLKQERLKAIDIAMAGLAIFVLSLLVMSLVFEPTPEQEGLFGWIDLGVCAIFITELGLRFHKASSKRGCLRDSWADILGSIPAIVMEMGIIRAFRLFRVARVARRRTRWKPKQKLRKEDIPFLLTEYRVAKSTSHFSFSLVVAFFTIVAIAFSTSIISPNKTLEGFVAVGLAGEILSIVLWSYYRKRASQIGEVLKIEKRLKRYGVDRCGGWAPL